MDLTNYLSEPRRHSTERFTMEVPPPKPRDLSGSHKPSLDRMTPAMIRVVAEYLLYIMDTEQRRKFMNDLPGIYKIIVEN
jgi:hypothetical protein